MKAFAVLAVAVAAAKFTPYSIAIEPEAHEQISSDCFDVQYAGMDDGDRYTDYFCVLKEKLPFDSMACFLRSVKIVRSAEENAQIG